MEPRHRRPRRYAGAYQDHADGDVAKCSRPQERTRARNLAGGLSDRASRPPASARDRAAICRNNRLKAKPAADRSAAGSLRRVLPERLSPPGKLLVGLDIDVLGF